MNYPKKNVYMFSDRDLPHFSDQDEKFAFIDRDKTVYQSEGTAWEFLTG